MAVDALRIMQLESEARNCRRIAEGNEGTMRDYILKRAEELDEEVKRLRERKSQ